MTPDSVPVMILSLVGGAIVGWVCIAGLWATVQGLSNARRPVTFYIASLVARVSLVATVMILSAIAGFGNLALCLLGFVVARLYLQTRAFSDQLRSYPAAAK